MALTVSDVYADLSGNPLPSYAAWTYTGVPFLENFSGTWKDVASGTASATVSAADGSWSLVLPWPSVTSPNPLTWYLHLPDGTLLSGLVPEGVSGPVSARTLKSTYGWIVVVPVSQ